MIKNEVVDIKIIFKTYLKILKQVKNILAFELFHKMLENNVKKLFSKIVSQNCFRK